MAEYIVKKIKDGSMVYENGIIKTYEEVIRCRDCKFSYNCHGLRCHSTQWSNPDESPEVDPDGFCAWAVRDE